MKIVVNKEAEVTSIGSGLQNSIWVDGKAWVIELCYLLRETDDQKFSFGWIEG